MSSQTIDALSKIPEPKGRTGLIIVLVGIAIGLGVFFIWYFQVDPLHPYIDVFVGAVQVGITTVVSWASGVFADLGARATKDPIAAASTFAGGAAAAVSLVTQITTKRKAAEAVNAANAQVTSAQKLAIQNGQKLEQATVKIDVLEKQLQAYKDDTFPDEARKVMAEQYKMIEFEKGQVMALQEECERLRKKIPAEEAPLQVH